ncbi:MAG: hypothetical protein U9Q29_05000 [Campylobacterota bacterium]|nr:hypothetical protein [Campylobacterota bacterium]
MKSFFIILTFILLIAGCADKNAFSKFDMTTEQELSASSLQTSKVKFGEEIDGTFSAIYLNEVYPKAYYKDEYFFISLYLKEEKEELNLKLNSKSPIKIEQLSHANKFSHLIATKNEWKQYYLITFKEDKENKLSLILENGQSSSAALAYQKDE